MATLKYRNSDGTYIAIPALQGPKGDKGDKGDKGNTGPAGGILDVYESSTKGYITVKKADSTTKNVPVGDPNALLTTGGAMTGAIQFLTNGFCEIRNGGNDISPTVGGNLANIVIDSWYGISFTTTCDSTYKNKTAIGFDCRNGIVRAASVYGAVWNDYAEYREANTTEPGCVVYEVGDDTLALANERMMPACSIISDTFGFAIGETEKCKTPLAQAGRVLAYPLEDRNSYKPGDAVCSGPNGTVSKMTQEEKINHPECIIGYVSCVPTYETWGEKDTKVNGRIWIKVV